jgi:putative transposase
VARSALDYRSAKSVRDAPVVSRMAALSAQYPRYGYRRIRIFRSCPQWWCSWRKQGRERART